MVLGWFTIWFITLQGCGCHLWSWQGGHLCQQSYVGEQNPTTHQLKRGLILRSQPSENPWHSWAAWPRGLQEPAWLQRSWLQHFVATYPVTNHDDNTTSFYFCASSLRFLRKNQIGLSSLVKWPPGNCGRVGRDRLQGNKVPKCSVGLG